MAEEEHVWEAFLALQGSLVEISKLEHPLPEPGRKARLRAGAGQFNKHSPSDAVIGEAIENPY